MQISEFEKCVLGPVAMPDSGHGVPDGGTISTIVVDHRTSVSIHAVRAGDAKGKLAFALVPSALGGVAMLYGEVDITTYTVTGGQRVSTGTSASTIIFDGPHADTGSYYLIPFSEWMTMGIGGIIGSQDQNGAGLSVQNWRIVSQRAHVSYTGPTLADGGAVAIARQNVAIADFEIRGPLNVVVNYTPSNRQVSSSNVPFSFQDVANLTGGIVHSARESFELNNLPNDFKFQGWVKDSAITTSNLNGPHSDTNLIFNQVVTDGTNFWQVASPGIGHAPTTFVHYDGLDKDASSICVQTRTCTEYTVAFGSSVQRFAKPGPPVDAAAIARVHEAGRMLPAALKTSSGPSLSGALTWYANTMENVIGNTWKFGAGMVQRMSGINTQPMQNGITGMQNQMAALTMG